MLNEEYKENFDETVVIDFADSGEKLFINANESLKAFEDAYFCDGLDIILKKYKIKPEEIVSDGEPLEGQFDSSIRHFYRYLTLKSEIPFDKIESIVAAINAQLERKGIQDTIDARSIVSNFPTSYRERLNQPLQSTIAYYTITIKLMKRLC